MMFNDEDKIFTFVYFEVRVSPSGMVTHRFVEIEPYAQGLFSPKIDARLVMMAICLILILAYIIIEIYQFLLLQVNFSKEYKAAIEEDERRNNPGSRKKHVLEDYKNDREMVAKQIFYINFNT